MKRVILLPTFLLIFFGCVSQPRIFTDIDKNYNPAEYNTYIIEGPKLEDSPSQLSVNPILLQRIERAIHLALEDRGLSESPEPDMIVRFFIGTQREVDRSYDSFGYYRRGYWESSDQRHHRVDRDVISIRFHDKDSDEVFWFAFSRYNRLSSKQDQESINSFIKIAIKEFKTAS